MMKNNLLKTALCMSLLASIQVLADEGDSFVGVSTGYTHTNIDQKDNIGSIIIGNKLEENGYNFGIEYGYHYLDNLIFTINAQRINQDDTYQNNIYVGAEYLFQKIDKFTPYIGVQIGYSKLQWKKNPVNTISNDINSNSSIYGAVVGFTYTLAPSWKLNLNYQLQLLDHDTQINLTPASSTLTHNMNQNLNIGVRYYFCKTDSCLRL